MSSYRYKLIVDKKLYALGTEKREIEREAKLLGGKVEKLPRAVPVRYLQGIPVDKYEQRLKEIAKEQREGTFQPLKTDKGVKTRRSKWSRQFEKVYGERPDDVKDVSRLTGVPKRILKKVYDKGLAAWSTGGHRPGASQHGWAMARVQSFVLGGPTQTGPDKKLAIEAGLIENPSKVKSQGQPAQPDADARLGGVVFNTAKAKVYIGTLLSPKTLEPLSVWGDSYSSCSKFYVLTPDKRRYIGSGYWGDPSEDGQDGTGCVRQHMSGLVNRAADRGKGLGTTLYVAGGLTVGAAQIDHELGKNNFDIEYYTGTWDTPEGCTYSGENLQSGSRSDDAARAWSTLAKFDLAQQEDFYTSGSVEVDIESSIDPDEVADIANVQDVDVDDVEPTYATVIYTATRPIDKMEFGTHVLKSGMILDLNPELFADDETGEYSSDVYNAFVAVEPVQLLHLNFDNVYPYQLFTYMRNMVAAAPEPDKYREMLLGHFQYKAESDPDPLMRVRAKVLLDVYGGSVFPTPNQPDFFSWPEPGLPREVNILETSKGEPLVKRFTMLGLTPAQLRTSIYSATSTPPEGTKTLSEWISQILDEEEVAEEEDFDRLEALGRLNIDRQQRGLRELRGSPTQDAPDTPFGVKYQDKTTGRQMWLSASSAAEGRRYSARLKNLGHKKVFLVDLRDNQQPTSAPPTLKDLLSEVM